MLQFSRWDTFPKGGRKVRLEDPPLVAEKVSGKPKPKQQVAEEKSRHDHHHFSLETLWSG